MTYWQCYPKYKPSGVEWLGEVPEGWNVIQIHHLCSVKRGSSPRPIDDSAYFDDNGEYAWVRISDVTASKKYLLKTEQRLSEYGKQFSVPLEPYELFLSMAGTVGKPIITMIKCCIHDGFVFFKSIKQNKNFLFYLLSYDSIYGGLGKWGTQLNLNTETIGQIKIPVPPLPEQHAIAAFLDRETARIDALIKKKVRQIELLQEKRSALISHSVTKGLDPNAKMKDSGIEWLGMVPEKWEVLYLGRLSQLVVPMRDKPPEFDGDIPWIRIEDFDGKYISDSKTSQRVSLETVKKMNLKIFPVGTVLCSCSCRMGSTAIVVNPLISNQTFIGIIPKNDLNYTFLYYLMSASSQELQAIGKGAIQQYLSREEFSHLKIASPPLPEQHAIAAFLDRETARIDGIIEKINGSIEKLNEYRSALISAAVTGKIDVRQEIHA